MEHTIILPLGDGNVVIFDAADYALVARHNWRVHDGYIETKIGNKTTTMHRLILGLTEQYPLADHINCVRHDNRRVNLRTATNAQSAFNRKGKGNLSSIFKGVSQHGGGASWRACITFEGKKHYLGSYASEKDAAIVYDHAARGFFGEFANLNFPNEVHEPPVRLRHDPRAYRKYRPRRPRRGLVTP